MQNNKPKMTFRTNHWQIAWKWKNEDKYHIIANPKWGWCADPFLVEYEDSIYLFAEAFLYKSERNGVIVYCKFCDGKWGDWVVTMDRHWHLSYPNVWVEEERLLMCPESYQIGEIAIYELIDFPDKWKKIRTLISNVSYCDTTFVEEDDEEYLFTYDRELGGTSSGKGLIGKVIEGKIAELKVFSEKKEGNRCGGKVIRCRDKIIRVAQNCKDEYGKGLIFYEIDALWPKYMEHEIKRVFPQDISIYGRRKYIGIHTYNVCGDIEVIDLKYKYCSIKEYIARKRVRKVFCNKFI